MAARTITTISISSFPRRYAPPRSSNTWLAARLARVSSSTIRWPKRRPPSCVATSRLPSGDEKLPAMIDLARLRDAFCARYGGEPRLFRAPGRVNLIGEHTDYNDGFVLPMAIDREVVVAAAARGDRRVRAYSLDLDATVEFDLARPGPNRRGSWLDYLEGVAQALEATGVRLAGADLAIASDVPVGAGLSSSAALEVA